MKQVLLIGIAPTLRYYITKKLQEVGIFVIYVETVIEAMNIMKQQPVMLIIIDYSFSRDVLFNFFAEKQKAPTLAGIPSIVLGRKIAKVDIALLASYGVKKVISKPVRVDELLSSIGIILGTTFPIDPTPCILETRVNEDVIFIELAQGLNRDKLELLQFRIIELIESYKLTEAKILIILTDLNLTYADTANLEYLIDNILAVKVVSPKNVKLLTLNQFVKDFFSQNPDYNMIEVVGSLAQALSALLQTSEDKRAVAQTMLNADNERNENIGNLETRFKLDTAESLSIAVVDDDLVVRKMMTAIFSGLNAEVALFENGEDFLNKIQNDAYDVIFLDMIMPGMSGIDVLIEAKKKGITVPFVILSSVTQRDTVIKALEKGAKRYILKPIKKETVLRKMEEVLGASL
ncbi:response regulator [Treponema putidum]|uniref:response regulator n=1 Tax=Treponema putidum TaxID=221027 RepID=UPI0004F73431|nr:response regulator [Treponema putidum]AIN92827.1 chemotaxis protein CheY [Treponema putidum]TWI74055.1 response regulator receiver domain-containing protein [Treponema putidum]